MSVPVDSLSLEASKMLERDDENKVNCNKVLPATTELLFSAKLVYAILWYHMRIFLVITVAIGTINQMTCDKVTVELLYYNDRF